MSDKEIQDSTTVEQVDVNIDELFSLSGADNVMLPEQEEEEETKESSMFKNDNIVDTSFLDKTEEPNRVRVRDRQPEHGRHCRKPRQLPHVLRRRQPHQHRN